MHVMPTRVWSRCILKRPFWRQTHKPPSSLCCYSIRNTSPQQRLPTMHYSFILQGSITSSLMYHSFTYYSTREKTNYFVYLYWKDVGRMSKTENSKGSKASDKTAPLVAPNCSAPTAKTQKGLTKCRDPCRKPVLKVTPSSCVPNLAL